MPYQYFHIGKTGGTLIRDVLMSLPAEHRRQFRLYSHDVTLWQAVEDRPDMPVFFSVRRPETLFVSAFNSRRRKGQPAYDRPWNKREQIVFSAFDTANDLAEGLSASDPRVRAAAELSMYAMSHVRKGLRWYLRDADTLNEHRDHIAFVLLQERLEDDLRSFAEHVGVPLDAATVQPGERRHAALEDDKAALSETGLANLRDWYGPDQEIYDWCVQFHDRLLAA
jgi:hypothetical protein